MQTSFQKEESVRLGSVTFEGDFGSGYVDLGGLKGASLAISLTVIQLIVDNAKGKPRNKINSLTLNANLYEFDLSNFRNITGLGEFATVDGTPTTATQTIASVGANETIILDAQNGDGSLISALTSAKAGGTDFTDYQIVEVGGKSAVLFQSAKTDVEITYSYTPSQNQQLVLRDVIKSQKLSKFRFINTNGEGKRLIIEFPQGYSSGDSIEMTFQADETNDDAMNYPISITAFPDEAQKLCVITDEQNIL